MTVLIVLTLVYVAVLVVALAASLIATLVYLLRIRRALRETADALAQARDRTRALQADLTPLDQGTEACERELRRAEQDMDRVKARLARVWEDPRAAATG